MNHMNDRLLDSLNVRLQEFLSSNAILIPSNLAIKPRACAEAFEELLKSGFSEILGTDGTNYQPSTRAKATADLSFTGNDGKYYAVDIKTHCMGKWGMPNLISYKKLDRFYENDDNNFLVLLIDYNVVDGEVTVESSRILPIECLSWDCLAVQGTLGQIQIKNAEKICVEQTPRKVWLTQFQNNVISGITIKQRSLLKELEYFKNKLEVPQ